MVKRRKAEWQYGVTDRRGYGAEHQAERKRRLRRVRPSDPCARCGLPLATTDPARLHLDHTDDRRGYLPGLSHATCNESANAWKRTARTGDAETRERTFRREFLGLPPVSTGADAGPVVSTGGAEPGHADPGERVIDPDRQAWRDEQAAEWRARGDERTARRWETGDVTGAHLPIAW